MHRKTSREEVVRARDRFVITLPPSLIDRLRDMAVAERRSLSIQTELVLERGLDSEDLRQEVAAA